MTRNILRADLVLVLLSVCIILTQGGAVAQTREGVEISVPPKEAAPQLLTAADLIRFATELAERESILENNVAALRDLSVEDELLSSLYQSIEKTVQRLERLRSTTGDGYEQMAEFKALVLAKERALQEAMKPISQAIGQLELWKTAWLNDRNRLRAFTDSPPQDIPKKIADPTVAKAQRSIQNSLDLISKKLNLILPVQEKAADIQARVDSLEAAVNGMLVAVRTSMLRKSGPSMFSGEYYAQFRQGLWSQLRLATGDVQWPGKQFIEFHGWKVFLQCLIIFVLAVGIRRHRDALAAGERWEFLARRPFSASLFVSMWLIGPFYGPVVRTWSALLWTLGAVSASRLLGAMTPDKRKKTAFFYLALLIILFHVFRLIGFPLPLFRLYVLLVSLTGFFVCLQGAFHNAREKKSTLYTWLFGLGATVFLVVCFSEIGGHSGLASHVLESSLKTVFVILVGRMFLFVVRSALELAANSRTLQRLPRFRTHEAAMVNRLMLLIGGLVFSLVTMIVLVLWRIYETPWEALQGMLSVGFTVGTTRVSLGLMVVAAIILYASFFVSWVAQGLLFEQVFPRRGMQKGVQVSIAKLIHYALVLVGFLIALGVLGVGFTNITILGGALGVGIGFGLQTIVNNFVCGLILLFERPITVGDYIDISGVWAVIKRIGLRSTVVETFDRADIVIPNSDLISNQVTNWTRSNRVMRIKLPVGVAYGSDVPLVMKILQEAAEDHPAVLSQPKPQILFMGFGDSSLDFELRVHIAEVDDIWVVRSEINQAIDREFRKAGVAIPFPQRDLHLRTVEESAAAELRPSKD